MKESYKEFLDEYEDEISDIIHIVEQEIGKNKYQLLDKKNLLKQLLECIYYNSD